MTASTPDRAGRARRTVVRLVLLVAAGLAVEYLVVPQLAGARTSWRLLSGVDPAWLVLALALEAASLAAYAALTRAVLPPGHRPSYLRLLGIDLSTLAVSHVVPAGSAVGLGLGYRLLTAAGVRGSVAVLAKTTQAVGSAVVLNLLLWVALVASIAVHGFSPVYGPVAALGIALLSAAGIVLALILRGRDHLAAAVARVLGRLPRVSEESVRDGVLAAVDNLRLLTSDRRLLVRAGALAAANWLLDAAALWVCVRAFGHTLGPDGAFVPYGISQVVAAVPITPGGLGLVEASLIPTLVAFQVPQGVAILGVLAWRLISFLLPVPVGGLSYLLLQRRPRGDTRADATGP